MSDRTNILLMITDQQRGDCLGVAGHPCLLTPQMDELASQGVRFTAAHTTCPACTPTRRCILSGMHPARNGAVTNTRQEWMHRDTLAQVLRDSGYHTGLVGMQMQPARRKRFGYEEMVTGVMGPNSDYQVDCLAPHMPDAGFGYGTGVGPNDRTARPWPYDEMLHPTTWTATQALRFFRRRDPSRPWFLTVSFLAPHPPAVPPTFYFERYLKADLPEPAIGDWAHKPEFPAGAPPVDSPRAEIVGEELRAYRAAYYAMINHVDDQIRRILSAVDKNKTLIVFISDHGDMLGDHYLTRKTMPYEADTRIPFIIRLPDEYGQASRGQVSDLPVCHEDLMPTLLDATGVEAPDGLDGRSLMPVLTGREPSTWRDGLHIEYGQGEMDGTDSFHAMTDGKEKFIWFSQTGQEQFFHIEKDPNELHDLIDSPDHQPRIDYWRNKLIETITWRGEGFVRDGKLVAGRPHPGLVAQYNPTESLAAHA